MFDPFAQRSLDVHNVSLLRALPMALITWLARQTSQSHTVLGGSDNAMTYTPAEVNGVRALSETQRDD